MAISPYTPSAGSAGRGFALSPIILREEGGDPSPGAELQADARLAQLAGNLLLIAAEEEAAAARRQSGAWIRHVLGSDSSVAEDWSSYAQNVRRTLGQSSLTLQEVQRLSRSAPAASGTFRQLSSLLRETDPELLAEGLLHMAQGNLRRNVSPQLTQALLHVTSEHPTTRQEAQALLRVMEGGGSIGQQLEFQVPRLSRELVSPLALFSFGSAIVGSRLASLSVLSRSSQWGWRALLASEGAALAVEIPAMVAARRLGTQVFVGGDNLFSPLSFGEEMLMMAGPFALLRGSSNLFQLASPFLRRHVGSAVLPVLHFSADTAAVMGGHALNGLWMSPEASLSFAQHLVQGGLMAGHMRVTGHVLDRLGVPNFSVEIAQAKRDLVQRSFRDLARRWRDSDIGFPPAGMSGLELASANGAPLGRDASAPRRAGVSANGPRDHVYLSEGDPTQGGSGGKPPPEPPSRWETMVKRALDYLQQYGTNAPTRDKVFGRLADRTHTILRRVLEKPDLKPDESLDPELEQHTQEVTDAEGQHSRVRNLVSSLRETLGKLRKSQEQLDPRVQREEENILRDEAQRNSLLNAYRRVGEILKTVREGGWNDQLRTQFQQVLDRLNDLYKNRLWDLPGLGRFRPKKGVESSQRDRVEGAVLGITASHMHANDSPLATELRGESPIANFMPDLELQYLHEVILGAAQREFHVGEEGIREIRELAGSRRVSEETEAAMVMMAEALSQVAGGTVTAEKLLDNLQTHPYARPLDGHFLLMRALLDPLVGVSDGLEQLTQNHFARDYFATGLYLFLRADGNAHSFFNELRAVQETPHDGFHSSIALSLFGAGFGRSQMPSEFLPPAAEVDAILGRAIPKEQ